jgi:hypothetical protein
VAEHAPEYSLDSRVHIGHLQFYLDLMNISPTSFSAAVTEDFLLLMNPKSCKGKLIKKDSLSETVFQQGNKSLV